MSSTPMSDQLADGTAYDPATEPKRPEASLGELVVGDDL